MRYHNPAQNAKRTAETREKLPPSSFVRRPNIRQKHRSSLLDTKARNNLNTKTEETGEGKPEPTQHKKIHKGEESAADAKKSMRMSGNHMQQPPPLPSNCLVPKKKKPCKVKGTCTMLLSLEQPAPTRQPVRRRAGQNDRKKKIKVF
jgi:hypothetical protein